MWLGGRTGPWSVLPGIADGREPDGGRCLAAAVGAEGPRLRSGDDAVRADPDDHCAGRASVDVDITSTIHPPAGQPGAATWPFVVTRWSVRRRSTAYGCCSSAARTARWSPASRWSRCPTADSCLPAVRSEPSASPTR